MWIEITPDNLPELGIPVIGFNPLWIDETTNPNGVRECFLMNNGVWCMAKWCMNCDEWHTWLTDEEIKDHDDTIHPPTHYFIPEPPTINVSKLIYDGRIC